MNGRYAKQFRKVQKKQLEMQIRELNLLQRLRLAINIIFKKSLKFKGGIK